MNTDKHRWFEMNSWWKAVAFAAGGLAFGVLMFVLGGFCSSMCDWTLLCVFTAPAVAPDLLGIHGAVVVLFFLSPLWWAAMFLCAAWPTKKALYAFIAGQCIHFAVAIWIVIEENYWVNLASAWEYIPMKFFIRLSCITIYLAGHTFLIWLRLRANRALRN